MYKLIVRPLLFCFDAEKIHYFSLNFLKLILIIYPIRKIVHKIYSSDDKKLERELFGIRFPNPVGLAAGFDKNGKYIKELSSFGFGFIEIGTITPKSQPGNPKKRLFRLIEDQAIINRMGINNDGNQLCIERLKKVNKNIVIGGNIGKNTTTKNEDSVKDFLDNFKVLHDYVDYFVINVSCPNVNHFKELQDRAFLEELLPLLHQFNEDKGVKKPILLKIAPDLNKSQLDETIEIVNALKIDGLVATNTTTKRDNLKVSTKGLEAIGNGGLSGLPLKDKSTMVIKYISEKSNKSIPIIGVGGIMTAEDAIEKINAGASLVQIYTGFIYSGPSLIKEINRLIVQ
ncbi:MAG: quinone-dependent dihydroorotate dehydrogenase [Flavobacteriales bacterium]|nr:quinone-dependent dihydroorotate dehydrogenase [Flavobacteriales bacterium]